MGRPKTVECRVQDRLEVAGVSLYLGDGDDHVKDLVQGEVSPDLVRVLRSHKKRAAGRKHAWATRVTLFFHIRCELAVVL
jgi:hypothetical protein